MADTATNSPQILTNGPGTCVILCGLAFILKVRRLFSTRGGQVTNGL